MNETNWAVLIGGGVAGFAVWYACNSVKDLRRAAAYLIKRAAAVEAAEREGRKAGENAYREACEYLNVKVKPCAATASPAPAGPQTTDAI